jgi:hypothetical protein
MSDGTHDNCTITVTDNASNTSNPLDVTDFTIGAVKPALAEVTPVPPYTNDNTSNYTFFSTLSGTINYGVPGSCSSDNDTAVGDDNNTITFNALADGTYDNCTVSVTNNGIRSDNLSVSSFTIDTIAPTLDNVTIASSNSVSTLAKTSDTITLSITSAGAIQAPSVSIAGQTATVGSSSDNITWSATYTMTNSNSEGPVSLNIGFSDLAGNAGDNVTSTTDNATSVLFDKTAPTLDNVTIASNNTLYTTMAKTGDNVTLSITSSEAIQTPDIWIAGQNATETGSGTSWSGAYTMASNSEGPVSLRVDFSDLAGNAGTRVTSTTNSSAVLFDRTSPILDEITPVPTPTSDNTSNYTFSSDEAGTIAYGGSCSSSTTAAEATNNTITFNAMADGTHDNCTITVTDNASNTSNPLDVTDFTIGAVKPALAEVTPVPPYTNDNTSNYTFFSTLSGTINYGVPGSCSSDNDTAVGDDNNTITFNALADGTYDNCTVSVTNNGIRSDNLSVSFFYY